MQTWEELWMIGTDCWIDSPCPSAGAGKLRTQNKNANKALPGQKPIDIDENIQVKTRCPRQIVLENVH